MLRFIYTVENTISSTLKIEETKVQRILKTFENEQQIAQQTSNQNRLITILNWGCYQKGEQQNEQQLHNGYTQTRM